MTNTWANEAHYLLSQIAELEPIADACLDMSHIYGSIDFDEYEFNEYLRISDEIKELRDRLEELRRTPSWPRTGKTR